jgi:hypothetical protein
MLYEYAHVLASSIDYSDHWQHTKAIQHPLIAEVLSL